MIEDNSLWVTKDGLTLSINEMETSHIRNCINMIKRNWDELPYYSDVLEPIDDFGACLSLIGQDEYDDDIYIFEPKLKYFEKELKKREKANNEN